VLHRVNLVTAILVIALLGLCGPIYAEIVHPVDYHYKSPGYGAGWTSHEDPGYGPPEWRITTPEGNVILHVPNQPRENMTKLFWLQLDFSELPLVLPHPQLTSEPWIQITGGNPTPNQGSLGFTWEWQLNWQPPWEDINFGNAFPWASVTNIEVASRCVPEPGVGILGLAGGLTALGLAQFRRRKKTS